MKKPKVVFKNSKDKKILKNLISKEKFKFSKDGSKISKDVFKFSKDNYSMEKMEKNDRIRL